MALCPWKIRLFSRHLIYSPGLDITNYGKTLYKQIHAPKHPEILGRKTLSGFNQLSTHLSIFWSKHCIKLPASITVSLEVVFCKLNKNLTKGVQWTALGFVCPHWISSFNFWIQINLCGSILGSATSSHSPVHGGWQRNLTSFLVHQMAGAAISAPRSLLVQASEGQGLWNTQARRFFHFDLSESMRKGATFCSWWI